MRRIDLMVWMAMGWAVTSCPAGAWEVDADRLYEEGLQWFQEHVSDEWKAHIELPRPDEWRAFWREMEQALQSYMDKPDPVRPPLPPPAPSLKAIFEEEGIPPELIWLAEVESSFNPAARSPVGATGLFQFMPATAERFGMKVAPRDDRLDPHKSARAAAQYLRFLHGRFDSWPLALAAYNAGEGRVGRVLKQHNGTSFEDIAVHLPSETQMYVPKVLATVALREGIDPTTLPPPVRRVAWRANPYNRQ